MKSIRDGKTEANVLKPVLCETFYNICKNKGKDIANQSIATLEKVYPLLQIDLDDALIMFTGLLKCQHRERLSYIDCMSLAFCINNRVEFHTTEKTLKQILPELSKKVKVVAYQFKKE
jgi:hypothetical protein